MGKEKFLSTFTNELHKIHKAYESVSKKSFFWLSPTSHQLVCTSSTMKSYYIVVHFISFIVINVHQKKKSLRNEIKFIEIIFIMLFVVCSTRKINRVYHFISFDSFATEILFVWLSQRQRLCIRCVCVRWYFKTCACICCVFKHNFTIKLWKVLCNYFTKCSCERNLQPNAYNNNNNAHIQVLTALFFHNF